MFLGYPNHSLLISSPAAICQSCRDTSPTGGKWYSFSGSAWLADGSQGPSPHVDQCGKPNHTPLLGMVYQLSIYLSIYIYIWVYHITYKHIQTHTNMFRIFQMVCFWVDEIQGPRWHQEFNKNPHLKHINSSKRTFRHSRCNPSTKKHRGQSTNSWVIYQFTHQNRGSDYQ